MYFRLGGDGLECVPATGGLLLAVNHASFLDPVLVGLVMRRPIHFMARDTLFKKNGFGWLLRAVHSVPVRREGASRNSLRAVLDLLEEGRVVLVFPEGTRSRDGRFGKFRNGIVKMSQLAGVPVLPVVVGGSHRALGRGAWLPRPARTRVYFGDPLVFEAKEDADAAVARLRERMLAIAAATPFGRSLQDDRNEETVG